MDRVRCAAEQWRERGEQGRRRSVGTWPAEHCHVVGARDRVEYEHWTFKKLQKDWAAIVAKCAPGQLLETG